MQFPLHSTKILIFVVVHIYVQGIYCTYLQINTKQFVGVDITSSVFCCPVKTFRTTFHNWIQAEMKMYIFNYLIIKTIERCFFKAAESKIPKFSIPKIEMEN